MHVNREQYSHESRTSTPRPIKLAHRARFINSPTVKATAETAKSLRLRVENAQSCVAHIRIAQTRLQKQPKKSGTKVHVTP